MNVELLLATKPPVDNGRHWLATFVITVPQYVWVELLTHKRLARNASSSRAQSTARHAAMGYYTPPVFYAQGTFMQAGEPLPEEVQAELFEFWNIIHEEVHYLIDAKLGALKARGYTWAREQVNRLFPTTKLVRGVVTATEDAWANVFALRAHPSADRAMRDLAEMMQSALWEATWRRSQYHIPFDEGAPPRSEEEYAARVMVAAARLARVSGGKPGPGQRPDEALAEDLLRAGHLSPFEHSARWVCHPRTSALASKPEDFWVGDDGVWGWENYRAQREVEGETRSPWAEV